MNEIKAPAHGDALVFLFLTLPCIPNPALYLSPTPTPPSIPAVDGQTLPFIRIQVGNCIVTWYLDTLKLVVRASHIPGGAVR